MMEQALLARGRLRRLTDDIRPAVVERRSENTVVASVVMKSVKMSVSFERALGDRLRSAARGSGTGVSSWLAGAAAKLRADALRELLDEWEAEHGAPTIDELRRAEAELGLRTGEPGA